MTRVQIGYAGSRKQITAYVVHTWHRGDLRGPIMSTSSGPKDYLCNDVWAAFEADRTIDAMTMIVANMVPFVIRHAGGKLYDAGGQEVICDELSLAVCAAPIDARQLAAGEHA